MAGRSRRRYLSGSMRFVRCLAEGQPHNDARDKPSLHDAHYYRAGRAAMRSGRQP